MIFFQKHSPSFMFMKFFTVVFLGFSVISWSFYKFKRYLKVFFIFQVYFLKIFFWGSISVVFFVNYELWWATNGSDWGRRVDRIREDMELRLQFFWPTERNIRSVKNIPSSVCPQSFFRLFLFERELISNTKKFKFYCLEERSFEVF